MLEFLSTLNHTVSTAGVTKPGLDDKLTNRRISKKKGLICTVQTKGKNKLLGFPEDNSRSSSCQIGIFAIKVINWDLGTPKHHEALMIPVGITLDLFGIKTHSGVDFRRSMELG
ncbi:hypothetical protein M8J77_007359 [Diaphorina citri]|nr:hypothetical protein M8J77_007359 [Diaphorina citri]